MSEKGGKPYGWSEHLWETYKTYGDWDWAYVESCNRFMEAILHLYPAPLSELILELKEQGTEAHPEDELDIYQAWYAKHIKWPTECFCEIEDSFVDPFGDPLMDFKEDTGEWVAPTQVRPWFLAASIQLGRHLAKGEVPEPRQGLLGQPKNYDTSEKIVKYLTESGWAVDQLWLEKAPDTWIPSDTRQPDESLKDFINNLFKSLNIFMGLQIIKKALTRPHHRVELKGGGLHPENKHEEMLVRKMFGATIPEIMAATQDALPRGDPRKAVYERVESIAIYLGVKPAAGDKT
jgi:hypothetical protein